jgi:hypothetical protein
MVPLSPGQVLPVWAALLLTSLCAPAEAHAGTALDFWHSYVHAPDAVRHSSFRLTNYKRGLFFGSCGPSTKSLQWAYDIDLAGPGPAYEKDLIKITEDGKGIELLSGSIAIDLKREQATINLCVKVLGAPKDFKGNGLHRIKKLK